MAHALRAAFDPHSINDTLRAIHARDVDGVRQKLETGVSAAHLAQKSPLMPLVYGSFEKNREAQATCKSPEEFEDKTSAILDMLLQSGMRVAEPEKYETRRFDVLADHFVQCPNLADGSTILIQAIYERLSQGRDGYQPRVAHQVAAYIDACQSAGEADDLRRMMCASLNSMENMHEVVRARLHNPATETEVKLVSEFGDRLGYWMGAFPRPSLARLESQLKFGNDGGAQQGQAAAAKAPEAKDDAYGRTKIGFTADI